MTLIDADKCPCNDCSFRRSCKVGKFGCLNFSKWLLSDAKTESNFDWIDSNVCQPEIEVGEYVLVYLPTWNEYVIASYCKKGLWEDTEGHIHDCDNTCWMPLPNKPKGVEYEKSE